MEVSVRELKNHLSEYLRRMQAGEDVVITSRGKAVARLTPVAAESANPEADVIERIDALPWVRPAAGGKPEGAAVPMEWEAGDQMLSEIVVEDRG